MNMGLVEQAVSALRNGAMLVVVDDEQRENEGDLVVAAEKISAKDVNFMATFGRGLICAPTSEQNLSRLDIPLMVNNNTELHHTLFTVSVDAAGTGTGISAFDRALTIKLLANPQAKPSDFRRPGHVFPLQAAKGGLKQRQGHTEAAVELATLAGLSPCAAICEIMSKDGTMARGPELEQFASRHGLKIITIAQLADFLEKRET